MTKFDLSSKKEGFWKICITTISLTLSQHLKNSLMRGAWVAQSVRHLTLDFGSGHDLRVMRSSPASGSAQAMESD